eukprot:scaffold27837_cov133-Isochrysis_galbana.AAC.2
MHLGRDGKRALPEGPVEVQQGGSGHPPQCHHVPAVLHEFVGGDLGLDGRVVQVGVEHDGRVCERVHRVPALRRLVVIRQPKPVQGKQADDTVGAGAGVDGQEGELEQQVAQRELGRRRVGQRDLAEKRVQAPARDRVVASECGELAALLQRQPVEQPASRDLPTAEAPVPALVTI